MGLDKSRLPPFWIKIAIFKVAFIAAVALLAAGAMIECRARAKELR